MAWHYECDLRLEKNNTIRIARELCYDEQVIKKLQAAKTIYELSRIMKDARLK